MLALTFYEAATAGRETQLVSSATEEDTSRMEEKDQQEREATTSDAWTGQLRQLGLETQTGRSPVSRMGELIRVESIHGGGAGLTPPKVEFWERALGCQRPGKSNSTFWRLSDRPGWEADI